MGVPAQVHPAFKVRSIKGDFGRYSALSVHMPLRRLSFASFPSSPYELALRTRRDDSALRPACPAFSRTRAESIEKSLQACLRSGFGRVSGPAGKAAFLIAGTGFGCRVDR